MYFDHSHPTVSQILEELPHHPSLLTSWPSYFNPLSPTSATLMSLEVGFPLEPTRGNITEEIVCPLPSGQQMTIASQIGMGMLLNFNICKFGSLYSLHKEKII